MPQQRLAPRDFRRRIKERQHVLGTFIKIPTSHTTEIVGLAGFDFVMIDMEHGSLRSFVARYRLPRRPRRRHRRYRARAGSERIDDHGRARLRCERHHGAALLQRGEGADDRRRLPSPRRRARLRHHHARGRVWRRVRGPDHIAEADATVTCIAMIEDAAALDQSVRDRRRRRASTHSSSAAVTSRPRSAPKA